MKRIVLGVLAALLLCGCRTGTPAESYGGEAEIARYRQEWMQSGEERIALQRNLARWYNLKLRQQGAGDFREAYASILFYSEGILGSVEAGETHLPVYHGPGTGRGFSHDPESAFPMGQPGDHPVLITTAGLELSEGDTFTVHILDESLVYQICSVRREPDTVCVPGVDYCSLIRGDGTQFLGIRLTEGEAGT